MEKLKHFIVQVELIRFTGKWTCIEQLDNALQDVLAYMEANHHKPSGELLELRSCSWVLHERYHMDNEEQMKWTFHHTKHKMLRSCRNLLERIENKLRKEMVGEDRSIVGETEVAGIGEGK